MDKVATFEKVSFEQFKKDYVSCVGELTDDYIREIYDSIQIPKRATKGSAGYDFCCTINKKLIHNNPIKIPTGIRSKIRNGYVLMLYPRSSMGFKYGVRLVNTTGVIDEDYYNADNEGHIMAKIASDCDMELKVGDRFMQGVFIPYGVTTDDNTDGERKGGIGSTGV